MSALYLNHFGLIKPPFQITPDIDFFFSGNRRGDILTALLHVARHEEGIVTAVAEVGSGKTLLARLMLSRLPASISTVYLANPCFSRDEIISAIARDLGLLGLPAEIEGKLAALHQELLRRHGQGQRVLLVIDEAHTMPVESLEEVRLLSNLETGSHKLVNIMLFGQPELDELLADRRLRQVRDRVIHRFELPPLPRDEGAAYIDHRLRTAGWHGGNLFQKAALDLLLKASGGRARRINLLADKSLLAAYAEGKQQIELQHVKNAQHELQADPVTPPHSGIVWRQVLPVSLALAVLMTAVALWLIRPATKTSPAQTTLPATSTTTHAATTTSTIAVTTTTTVASTTSTTIAATTTTTVTPTTTTTVEATTTTTTATLEPKPISTSPRVIDAASRVRAAFEHTAEKLRQPGLNGYTLQLASLSSEYGLAEYLTFIQHIVDSEIIFADNRKYNEKTYVAIYLGHYETEQEAKTALNKLPKPLKTHHPIIRTWTGIVSEAKP